MNVIVQNNDAVESLDSLILTVGLGLLVVVVALWYREYRLRKIRRRELTTRMMIGGYDLYNPADCSKLEAIVDDLYAMYLVCSANCGMALLDTPEQKQQFVELMALPHIDGRLDLSSLPPALATAFREKYELYLKEQSA